MLEKGKKVGEYVLLEKLGAGGFGDVWKAEKRTVLDVNHFALKFFRPKQNGVDFDKIGKELAVWKQLRGLPHIISVIELDRFEDYVYVVSDFADGGSLENWLKNNGGKAQTETEAVQIALEILTGLENLHGKNFVHRDLKPDNILIMNGRHCLADFGISREIKTHSKATGTAGTMEYMPPEAFDKTPSVTPQTDIWAVGAILQRLLTGKLPYPQDEQPSLIAAILMSEPDEMPETVSQSLREIVRKSLQKKREDRFQSANEMREVLRDVLNPPRFVEGQTSLSIETIVLEDSEKTAKYEIKPTKEWWVIEAEKKRQRKLEENKVTEEKTSSAAHFFETANSYFEKGEFDSAIINYSKALLLKSDHAEAYNNRGLAYSEKGDYVQAVSDLDKAIKLKPDAARYYSRGVIYATISNYDEAIKDYNKAITLEPDCVPAYFYRGRAYCGKNNFNQALKDYTQAIELEPDFANAYYERGNTYCYKGNYDQALKDYDQAIKLSPSNAFFYNYRGFAYYNKGNYDQAISDYLKALQIDPNYQVAKDNLQLALKQKNSK